MIDMEEPQIEVVVSVEPAPEVENLDVKMPAEEELNVETHLPG